MKRFSTLLALIGLASLLAGAMGRAPDAKGVVLGSHYQANVYSADNTGWWDFGAFDFTASDWVPGTATSGFGNHRVDYTVQYLDRWYGLVLHDYAQGCFVQVTWVISDNLIPVAHYQAAAGDPGGVGGTLTICGGALAWAVNTGGLLQLGGASSNVLVTSITNGVP